LLCSPIKSSLHRLRLQIDGAVPENQELLIGWSSTKEHSPPKVLTEGHNNL